MHGIHNPAAHTRQGQSSERSRLGGMQVHNVGLEAPNRRGDRLGGQDIFHDGNLAQEISAGYLKRIGIELVPGAAIHR